MKRNSQAFVNQLLVCLLVSIGFGGTIGLGTVWMRYQISHTADVNRQLQAQIDAVERRIAEKATALESEKTPALLRERNEDKQLGLAAVQQGQVVHIAEDPIERLARAANRALFREVAGSPDETDRPKPASAPITLRISLTR